MPWDASKFLAGLGKAVDAQIEAAVEATDIFGEQVIGDAQQLTPVATGALQASGTTLPTEVTFGKIEKTMGFNTNYAAAVHERLASKKGNPIRHDVGQAKFLETAMKNNQGKFQAFVAERVRGAMDGGSE